MENSHPRILLYLCKKHNINCKNLIEYINNREYFLKKISDNRKEAKTLIDDKTIFNYKGKSLSRILLELENKILQVMIDFFKFKNIQIFTLEYDGLKIIDKPDNKYFSIKQLEYIIF